MLISSGRAISGTALISHYAKFVRFPASSAQPCCSTTSFIARSMLSTCQYNAIVMGTASTFPVPSRRKNSCENLVECLPLRSFSSTDKADKSDRPQMFHLDHVKKRLEFTVPLLFESRLDYTFYRKDVVLDDQIFQMQRIGLHELMNHFGMISVLGRFGFSFIEMKPLSISPILEDGTVRLRWRIQYLTWLQFLNFRNYNETNRKKNVKWYDGYSIFYVDGEGFVYKATIQKTMPDDSQQLSSMKDKTKKLAQRVGVLPMLRKK